MAHTHIRGLDNLSSPNVPNPRLVRRTEMSAVIAVPEIMTSAATDLAKIGLNLNAAHVVAATPTLAVLPAAADEVSTGVAHLFSQYAEDYQRLAGKAAAFQEQFAQHLTGN